MSSLTPTLRQRFFDHNGLPLVGGQLFSYRAGTSTPLATYTDQTQITPNTNPIILDSNGECALWIDANAYKFILQDASSVVQWSVDQVLAATGGGGSTGAQGLPGSTIFLPGDDGIDGEMGPPGPQGASGPTGSTGLTGAPGTLVFLPGDDGLDGEIGPPGPAGASGSTGQTGGVGAPGSPVYLPGDDGMDGEVGPPGPQGVIGLTGNTGGIGPTGPVGAQVFLPGDDGIDGERGGVGLTGSAGITGAQGPGAYIFLPGEDGQDGEIGPPGVSPPAVASGVLVVQTKVTTYAAVITDGLILCSSSAFTVTLPTAIGNTGVVIRVKKTDSSAANIITIATTSAQTIDGATTRVIGVQYEAVTVVSDGANWSVIA